LNNKDFLGGCQKWQLGWVRAECLRTVGARIQQRQNEMNKPNSSAQQQDVNTCNAEPHKFGPCTPSSVLTYLWGRGEKWDTEELEFFSRSTEYAAHMAENLADTLSNVGCLIDADFTPGQTRSGNFEMGDNVARLLFVAADQLRTISALTEIGDEAQFALRERGAAHV
jgi:hypothetical protein